MNRRRYLAATLVALAAAAIAISLFGNRDRWSRADFHIYYSWWSEFRRGVDPWHPPAAATESPDQPVVSFCDYPPAYVVFLSPLAMFGQRSSYWIWQALMLGTFGLSIVMLASELKPRPGVSGIASIVALAMLYPPVHATLHGAQPAFLLLLLLSAAWIFDRRSRPATAGLMLALAALLKAYPGAVGGYFLFRRRWGALGWAIAFALLGIALSGIGRWREYFTLGFPTAASMIRQERMVAILPNVYQSLVHLVCPSGGCDPMAQAVAITLVLDAIVVALAAVVTLRASDDSGADGLCFAIWTIVALLLSPMSWDHELPLMLPTYLFAIAEIVGGGGRNRIAVALLGLGLAMSILPIFLIGLRPLHFFFLSAITTLIAAAMVVESARRSDHLRLG